MRKTDLTKKAISFLLVMAMMVSYAPVLGAATPDTDQTAVTQEEQTTAQTNSEQVSILRDGQSVSDITLPEDEKVTLTASFAGEGTYQWQIRIPETDTWVNIYDKTEADCEVSVSLLESLMDDAGTAELRCVVTTEQTQIFSGTVTVTVTAVAAPMLLVESEADPEPAAFGLSGSSSGVSDTYSVTIKYLYYNEGPTMTGSVANDYIATLAAGTNYDAVVSSPVRTGYKPYVAKGVEDWNGVHWFTKDADGNIDEGKLTDNGGTTYHIEIKDGIKADQTIYIIYVPQDTTFQVSAYLQNIYDDFYTFGGSASYNAKVGSSVLLLDITKREGFTTLQYDDAKVAADGSTILEVYYDREYHLMNFQLGGGYGVDPVYARYQTNFKVATPTRPGYDFAGWKVTAVKYEGEDASTEPMAADSAYAGGAYRGQTYQAVAEALANKLANGELVEIPPFDVRFTATWTPKTASYSVVYWKENANDTEYSYWGTVKINATAGQTVTFDPNADIYKTANLPFSHKLVQAAADATGSGTPGVNEAYSAIPARYEDEYFTYNAGKSDPTARATVNGDNSTVLNVYYSRNRYNLKFYFARTAGTVTPTTTQAYVPETEIVSGNSYVVVMNRAVTNGASGSVVSKTTNGSGLLLSGNVRVGGDIAALTALKFTEVEGKDLYYVQPSDNDTQYLTIGYGTAAFTTDKTKLKVTYQNGYWAIGNEDGTYWLNQLDGKTNTKAAGWTEGPTISGTWLLLYDPNKGPVAETKYVSDRSWYVSTSTRVASVKGAVWTDTGLTTITFPDDPRYAVKTSNDLGDGYTYYYLELADVKYEQDISQLWPSRVIPTVGTRSTPEWAPVDGCKFRTENGANATIKTYSTVSAEIINDPGNADTSAFVAWWTDSTLNNQYFHIYYSAIPDEETDTDSYTQQADGQYYVEQPTITYVMAYNGYTQITPITLYGVTLKYQNIKDESPKAVTDATQNSYFYYERNPHTLSFYNLGNEIKPKDKVVYGQSISSFNTLTAEIMNRDHYPSVFEPDAYTFVGWSLSPDTYLPVDWENYKMDDADLSVYAFWEKVTYTVTFYETYNDLNKDIPIDHNREFDGGIKYENPQTVPHGNPVNYASTISRSGFNFVGWFYIDDVTGEPVAFLPNNMPVKQNLKIYAEWQAETMVKYTIHYKLIGATRSETGEYLFADGYKYDLDYSTQTKIADDTTGQIQDGRTKTFNAKALPELWGPDDPNNPNPGTDYCHKHYPLLSSHAIMFSPDSEDLEPVLDATQTPPLKALKILNKKTDGSGKVISYEVDYTFYYVKLEEVQFKVRYFNTATNTGVFKNFATDPSGTVTMTVDPLVKTTQEAVTTERMKMIQGYIPDEYQKRVVLTVFPRPDTDDNIITFYYTEDPSPMYFVEHLIENANGTWTQMAKEFGTGKKGDTITRTANNYEGHEFNATQAWVNTSGENILPNDDGGENWIGKQSTVDGTKIFTGIYGESGTATGTLDLSQILVIRFYYTLVEYPYVIQHKILASRDWLFGSEDNSTEQGKAKYGETVTADASDNNTTKHWASLAMEQGYWVEGDQSDTSRLVKTMQITVEDDPENPQKNVVTFWYVDAPVEIQYRVVVDGTVEVSKRGCYVSPSQDSTSSHGNVVTDVRGSTPSAGPGYYFAGWFTDAACTSAVSSDWVNPDKNNKLTPKADDGGVIRAATYYAKFEPIGLTIKKEGANVASTDTFLFHVKGKADTATAGVDLTVSITGPNSTTIRYLPAGEYTIKEISDWSWRYDLESPATNPAEVIVSAKGDNKITFKNKLLSDVHWLGGETSVDNKFAAVSSGG